MAVGYKHKIRIENQGEGVSSVLHLPEYKNSPAVIICHGLFRNKDDKVLVELAETLCSKNIIVLRFDFRGCGASEGDSVNYCFDSEISDIHAAIQFLKKLKSFNGNMGIVGHSHGGASAILASQNRDDIKAVVTIAPVASPKDRWSKREIKEVNEQGYVIYKGFKVGKKMWLSAVKHNPKSSVRNIKCPILFIVGSEDLQFIPDAKTLLQNSKEPKKLVVVENGDHFFSKSKPRKVMIKEIFEWFGLYL